MSELDQDKLNTKNAESSLLVCTKSKSSIRAKAWRERQKAEKGTQWNIENTTRVKRDKLRRKEELQNNKEASPSKSQGSQTANTEDKDLLFAKLRAYRETVPLASPIHDESIDKTSKYIQPPEEGSFWTQEKILAFGKRQQQTYPELVCQTNDFAKKREFMAPVVSQNYVQFSYKKPQKVLVITNVYGVVVNNSMDFHDKTVVTATGALEPKHRPVLLIPTVKHWWHKDSKDVMNMLLRNFLDDLKVISIDPSFCAANTRFGISPQNAVVDFGRKILSKTLYKQGGMVPAVFPARIFTDTRSLPCKITIPVAEIVPAGLKVAEWDSVMVPTFMHCAIGLALTGFKITRSGYSLDLQVESLAYSKVSYAKPHTGMLFPDDFYVGNATAAGQADVSNWGFQD